MAITPQHYLLNVHIVLSGKKRHSGHAELVCTKLYQASVSAPTGKHELVRIRTMRHEKMHELVERRMADRIWRDLTYGSAGGFVATPARSLALFRAEI